MYPHNFDIKKENNKYYLISEGKKIKALYEPKQFVCDTSKSLIEYIRSDLDRNGEIHINDDATLTFNVFCAYHIFSRQKQLPNDADKTFRIAPMYDRCLVETTYGPFSKTQRKDRLTDIRDGTKKHLGEELFLELTECAWRLHRQHEGESSNEGISHEQFKKTEASKEVFNLIKRLSIVKQNVIYVLTEYLAYDSILLAIGLVEKWVSVESFVQAAMVIGSRLNSDNPEWDDEWHQDSYNAFQNVAIQSLSYIMHADISLPKELTLEESLTHEYKASVRTPYPSYPDAQVDEKGHTFYKLGTNKFKSKNEVHKFLETQCLKTIVAFLNTNGGMLVVGVHEKDNYKKIVGIGREDFKSYDEYERHISQLITNRIGKKFHGDFITIETRPVDDKSYCLITCKKYIPAENQIPAHLDQDKIFRRTGPRTDEIKGAEAATFAVERKNQNEE